MANVFLSSENTDLLWEVIVDDETIPKTDATRETFARMLPEFHRGAGQETDLFELNKLFIGRMLSTLSNASSASSASSRGEATNARKPLVTHEELQTERRSAFEKEMQEKESEFKNAITLQVPDAPDFKDNVKDAPLTNVSETIQRMIAERNFEIDTISKAHDKKKAEQWLSSSKTSIQDEKGGQGGQGGQGGEPLGATPRRMIKIDTADLSMDVPSISLGDPPKQVTWGQNSSIDVNVAPTSRAQTESATETKTDTGSDSFVFSKLKRVRDDATPSPETRVEPASGDDAMDVRRLYEYVTERFDRMERLLAERLNEN